MAMFNVCVKHAGGSLVNEMNFYLPNSKQHNRAYRINNYGAPFVSNYRDNDPFRFTVIVFNVEFNAVINAAEQCIEFTREDNLLGLNENHVFNLMLLLDHSGNKPKGRIKEDDFSYFVYPKSLGNVGWGSSSNLPDDEIFILISKYKHNYQNDTVDAKWVSNCLSQFATHYANNYFEIIYGMEYTKRFNPNEPRDTFNHLAFAQDEANEGLPAYDVIDWDQP